MQFIQEKLQLPLDRTLVSRRRLTNLLAESVRSGAITVIYGRARMGKTALAAQFSRISGRKAAWFKVDASDSDWRVFFRYLAAAIERQRPGFAAGQFTASIDGATLEDMPTCAEFLVFDLIETAGEPLLIVLEDLHLVFDNDWVEAFLSRFLSLIPPDIHILITARSRIPAPLWRLRSKQTLRVVEEDVLWFTIREIEDLLRKNGLPASDAKTLFKQSCGRVAVLERLIQKHSIERGRSRGTTGRAAWPNLPPV